MKYFESSSITKQETSQVCKGVTCDVYTFNDDNERDLGVVTVQRGHSTPLQVVLKGTQTIERFIDGSGTLVVKNTSGETVRHIFPKEDSDTDVEIKVGDTVQWTASKDKDLVFAEICTPPYEDGRFENI